MHLEQQTTGSQENNQGCLQMQINVTVSLFSHSAFEQCYMFFLGGTQSCSCCQGTAYGCYTHPVVHQKQKLDKILHVQKKRVYMQRKHDRRIISCCFHNPLITTAYLPQYHNCLYLVKIGWLRPLTWPWLSLGSWETASMCLSSNSCPSSIAKR